MGFGSIIGALAPAVGTIFGGPAGAAIGTAIGGIASAGEANRLQDERTQQTQSFNAEEAQKSRDFSAAQAKNQMDFQERMSNTAYQRATSDMRTAGINPLLAYAQGGASSPIGAAGTSSAASSPQPHQVVQPADVQQKMTATAQQAAMVQNVQAATDKTIQETKESAARTIQTGVRTELDLAEFRDNTDDGRGRTFSTERTRLESANINQQMHNLIAQKDLTDQQRNLVVEEVKNAQEQNRKIRAETRDITANAVLNELAEAQGQSQQRFWLSPYGGARAVGFKHYVGNANSAVGAAAGLAGIGVGAASHGLSRGMAAPHNLPP